MSVHVAAGGGRERRRRSEHRGRDEREPDGRVASARKVNEKDLDAKKRETRQVDVERNSAGKVQGDVIAVLRSVGDTVSRGACDDI